MKYSIRFGGLSVEGARCVTSFRVCSRDAEFLVNVGIPVSRALFHFSPDRHHIDEHQLALAAGQWALPRIEAALIDGTYESMDEVGRTSGVPLNPSGNELDSLVDVADEKLCRYQVFARDDALCNAGFREGKLPFESVRVRLPTSKFLCGTCTLPDSRILCSHLHHAMIQRADGPTESGMIAHAADCDLGKNASPPGVCRFRERECWERTVETAAPRGTVQVSPLALHEAIGYLDAVWRNAFGKEPLVVGNLLLAGGMLGTPCDGLRDFTEKVKGVVDAFDAFRLPPGKGNTLERMGKCLREWSEVRGVAQEDFAPVDKAIGTLRQVVRLRANFEHSDARARDDFERAQCALEIRLPAVSYSEEWQRLVARLASSLAVVRDFLRQHG